MRKVLFIGLAIAVAVLTMQGCGSSSANVPKGPPKQVRLGYFANITHAQALIGMARGDFQKAIGDVPLKTVIFNAGPSAMEAINGNKVDVTYVGPGPAVNAFVNSGGLALRVISGSAANGVVIVVHPNSGIKSLDDLKGKRIATPQHANTQDISARAFVKDRLHDKDKRDGGTTDIQPIANADQIGLFKQNRLDAAWAPEPWGSRLIQEAGATALEEEKNLWEEKKFATTLLVVSKRFLDEYPDTVEALLKAHLQLTEYVRSQPDEAAALVNTELQKQLGKPLSPQVLKEAFARVEFTSDPLPSTIDRMAQWNFDLGFIKQRPELKNLVDLTIQKRLQAAK